VATAKDSALWVTQIEGSVIEEAGVIKMDFLGLKTLSILKTALQLIKQNHNKDIDLDNIPLDDEAAYQLYQRGDTNGTFQFESVGMQKYLRELKPDKFDDLIAMNALYRPGPLAYIPNFIDRKHGREPISYDLPEMEDILAETYGITVYQEQVMLLSQKLANFSKGDADVLRKAMGKKQKAVLDKMKTQFITGATKNGHNAATLEKIWTDWEAFAQYAFNKSHSTCYAFVAYQTAYLKAHYPSEYMAAVLNHAGAIEKITFFMEECKRMGLPVLGPDINESQKGFAVNSKGEIRFGLGGLKGVGEAAIEAIVEERKKGAYTSIFDLIKRVNQRAVNKKSLECLAYSGAFDCFADIHRAQYFFTPPGDTSTGMEKIVRFGNIYQNQAANTSNTLFGDLQMPEITVPKLPDCPPWTLTELLDHEKDITGIFLSGHPLDHFRFEMKHYGINTIAEFNELKENVTGHPNPFRTLKIAGLVADAQHRTTRNGKQFGVFHIEDYSGKTEIALFGEDYVKFKDHFSLGNVLFVTGNFKTRWNSTTDFEFKLSGVMLLETVKRVLTRQVQIGLHPKLVNEALVTFVDNNVRTNPGKSSIKFVLYEPRSNYKVSMYTLEKGFEMNDEMTAFLEENPDMEVNVTTL
jgi:DNA polymerase-3 subunit alpha